MSPKSGSNKSNKGSAKNTAKIQGGRIESSNQLNKDREGNLDRADNQPPTVPGFNLNPDLDETYVAHLSAGNPELVRETQDCKQQDEKSSSKNSEQDKKELREKKNSTSWEFSNMKCAANLCRQTKCIKKVGSAYEKLKNMNKWQKTGVALCVIFIAAVILVPTIVLPIVLVGAPPGNIGMGPIQFNGTMVNALFSEGRSKNNHSYYAHAVHKKIEVPHPTLEAVTKMVRTSSNQEEIHCNVPILAILSVCGFSHKQEQAYENWLDQYNANPIQVTEKLIDTMKNTLSRPGTFKFGQKIQDNLTLVSLKERLEIDIEYDPFDQKFFASNFKDNSLNLDFEPKKPDENEKNLKKEDNSKPQTQKSKTVEKKESDSPKDEVKPIENSASTEDKQKDTKTAEEKELLMSRAMLEAVYYVKRVVARNIEVIRAKTAELMGYQLQVIDDNDFNQDWQKALVNGCRTLNSLRFRCSIEAAGVLVPGLTLEKIRENGDYLVSQTLNLVFKEVKNLQE